MKRPTINVLCGLGILIPLGLLFWPMPYIMWHPLVETILSMIAAISAQLLFCRISKLTWIRILPLILTGLLAGWGTFLYFTSEFWVDSTFMGFFSDYISPFIGCVIVWVIWSFQEKDKS